MFYKLIIDEQGNIEVVDRVDHAKRNDGQIYATEKEFALLNKRIVFNYNDEIKDICQFKVWQDVERTLTDTTRPTGRTLLF